MGAKRHEFPIMGSSFGPGISEYDLASGLLDIGSSVCFDDDRSASIVVDTSFGNILIAEEKVVLLTRELAAALVPILHDYILLVEKKVEEDFILLFGLQFY